MDEFLQDSFLHSLSEAYGLDMDPSHFPEEEAYDELNMPGLAAFDEPSCEHGWCHLNGSVGREALQSLPSAAEGTPPASALTNAAAPLAYSQGDGLFVAGLFSGVLLAAVGKLVHQRSSPRRKGEWNVTSLNIKQV